jgi:anaerobic magnesium-protoporphyrin IX monomethyl ester cyclase
VAYPITGTPLYNEVNSSIQVESSWNESSDRDYDFNRGHSKKFYQHAVNWVTNEVSYKKTGSVVRKMKYKSRSLMAQALMLIS